MTANQPDPTVGMPADLVRVLRDPTITIQRDHEIRLADGRTLFEHLEEWRNAPSNTASADLPVMTSDGEEANVLAAGVRCGICKSEAVYMQPCPECIHVQASICFGCGEVYRLGNHHADGCPHSVEGES